MGRENTLQFVWFWTFWHWSTEGFRSGALLRSPVQGIGSHWDEWFRNETSDSDRDSIKRVGISRFEQRRFVAWLARRWAREAEWRGSAPPARFVLAQLSQVSPFDEWPAFEKHRTTYGAPGISAIVLDEASSGETTDVRPVEALVLPTDEDAAAHDVIPEGFRAESADLSAARKSAASLLAGKGLLVFLGLWLATGRRPYPRWLAIVLLLGWMGVAGLIVRLLTGPDPGDQLTLTYGILLGLWVSLVLTASTVATVLTARAWLLGRSLRKRLEQSQTRLRINGGLDVQGGSAGLAFCLNTLLATYRTRPRPATHSWLWARFFQRLRVDASSWAATGIVDADGHVERVAIEPKIRACLHHPEVRHILTPWQREARQSNVDRLASSIKRGVNDARQSATDAGMTLAFAAEGRRLRSHRCRHAAQSIMAVGNLTSVPQMAVNVLAFAVSIVMLVALPDLRSVLQPAPPPAVVGPSSPSPYFLWVSLDTRRPEDFIVVLESGFWSNRRVEVASYGGAKGSVRAEVSLKRLARQMSVDEENGTVWIERRRKFLAREYESGERIGSYSFSHINRLGHD